VIRTAVIALCAVCFSACASHATRTVEASGVPQIPSSSLPSAPAAARPAPAPGGGARLAQAALAMLGQPYRYGGTEPGGFDCSGLVTYAARNSGLLVPRTAQDQQRSGVPVARSALQPGDLVFLHLAGKDLHVGVAIDATHFVHAPSAGGRVRIDSLRVRPYSTAFLSARRLELPK
jgi:cell wall-associated NlpC family hydrolase